MKRSFFILTAVISLVISLMLSLACNQLRRDKPEDEPNIPPTEAEAPSKFIPFETQYVSVPEGQCGVVYMGSTKLATLYQSGNVIVPKKTVTKADGATFRIIYMLSEGETSIASENGIEMVVAFEDTKEADHDYNDLVFQAKVKIVNNVNGTNSTSLEITPVAHGATKTIGLGVVLYDSEKQCILDQKICSDVRQQLFSGDQGFINTQSTRKHYDKKEIELPTCTGVVAGVAWYIIVNGKEKLYAASAYKPCIDNFNRPQGMVLIHLRDDIYEFENGGTTYQCGNDFWQYPQEWAKIDTVYPDFDESFESYGDFTALATPAPGSKYYDAIKAATVGDKQIVNDDDCLYTLYPNGGDTPPTVEAVQLWAGGPKWATCNVGAENPEESGDFFQWGIPVGHPSTYDFGNDWKYQQTEAGERTSSYTPGDVAFDGARYNYGGNWRVPSAADFEALLANTDMTIINDYNGVKVYKFTSKTDSEKFIILPACGYVRISAQGVGTAYYWTYEISTAEVSQGNYLWVSNAWNLAVKDDFPRAAALPIRPICD